MPRLDWGYAIQVGPCSSAIAVVFVVFDAADGLETSTAFRVRKSIIGINDFDATFLVFTHLD